MVWHEVQFGEVRAALLDGFAPDYEVFANLDLWNQRITPRRDGLLPAHVYWGSIHRYIRSDDPSSESQLLSAFGNAVKGLRHGWCPYIDAHREPWYYGDPSRCTHWYYTSGTNRRSLEAPSWQRAFRRDPITLTPEYRRDRDAARSRYISNVFVYRTSEPHPCDAFRECCDNWVATLHFDIKQPELYLDLPEFTHAWSSILRQHVDRFRTRRRPP